MCVRVRTGYSMNTGMMHLVELAGEKDGGKEESFETKSLQAPLGV